MGWLKKEDALGWPKKEGEVGWPKKENAAQRNGSARRLSVTAQRGGSA